MQNFQSICKRAGGRRKYNATQRLLANKRRLEIIKLMKLWGWSNTSQTGVQAKIAQHLKVAESTISRDIWAILSNVSTKSN